MAEKILYDQQETSSEDSQDGELNKQVQIMEEEIHEDGKIALLCEICMQERQSVLEHVFEERVAVFLCFVCEMYVCINCRPEHRSHEGKEVGEKESEREMGGEASGSDRMEVQSSSERMNKGKGLGKKTKRMRSEEGSEREENESGRMEKERERKIRLLLDDLMKESKTERIEKFGNSRVRIYDRVNVKHKLDLRTDCRIFGLCILKNKRWVACDCHNSCIKIFSSGSNVLQRYIRVVGPGPWDVTEIRVNQNSNEPNLKSGCSSEVSVTARAEQDKQCLVAVTLLWEHQILFIDLSKKPALLHKVIRTEELCWAIEFYDGKIFTGCRKGLGSRWFVYIKSTDGDTLGTFDTGIYGLLPGPYLAVVSGRVYLTDRLNNKVQCRNVMGQVIKVITIEGSGPLGINVDPDNNVYVCAWEHNNVYKLDTDLTRYKSVLDQTAGYIEEPCALCYYRDQLLISHYGPPSLRKYVTVVRLL